MTPIAHVSGHLDLSPEEFEEHYVPRLVEALSRGHRFIVGDATGADQLAARWLAARGADATVFHMFSSPRFDTALPTSGGTDSDTTRDAAMTTASTYDIAWVRLGRATSGTARNLSRRAPKLGLLERPEGVWVVLAYDPTNSAGAARLARYGDSAMESEGAFFLLPTDVWVTRRRKKGLIVEVHAKEGCLVSERAKLPVDRTDVALPGTLLVRAPSLSAARNAVSVGESPLVAGPAS